jgi:hypothetical protein
VQKYRILMNNDGLEDSKEVNSTTTGGRVATVDTWYITT